MTVSVKFGGTKPGAKPIKWDAFKKGFLPKPKEGDTGALPSHLITAVVNKGLTKTVKDGKSERWVIDPKNFQLSIDSAIPVTGVELGTVKQMDKTAFGVAPMGVTGATSKLTVTLKRDGQDAASHFSYKPIKKAMPAAMWGNGFSPELNGDRTVDGLCTGLTLHPATLPKVGKSAPIPKNNLKFDDVAAGEAAPHLAKVAAVPAQKPLKTAGKNIRNTINTTIRSADVVKARNALLAEMGIVNPMNEIQLSVDPAAELVLT